MKAIGDLEGRSVPVVTDCMHSRLDPCDIYLYKLHLYRDAGHHSDQATLTCPATCHRCFGFTLPDFCNSWTTYSPDSPSRHGYGPEYCTYLVCCLCSCSRVEFVGERAQVTLVVLGDAPLGAFYLNFASMPLVIVCSNSITSYFSRMSSLPFFATQSSHAAWGMRWCRGTACWHFLIETSTNPYAIAYSCLIAFSWPWPS